MLYRRKPRYETLEDRRLLAEVTVNTLADTIDFNDGLTSLREAIFATNLIAGPDAINFAPTLFAEQPSTIYLTDGELNITDDLTIVAPGSNQFIIDASGSDATPDQNNGDGSRIFNIDNGNTATLITVTISGPTLFGGDARGSGGAILSRENVTLIDARVYSSSAVSNDLSVLSTGGGIAHRDGKLVVTNTEIASNVADFGAGIYLESGTLIVTDSQIGNNVGLSGSGVYNKDGDAAIHSSWIHGNAAGAFSLGGGIYNSGNLRVESTTISGNSASFGGGIFSRTDSGGAEVTRIINSTISGNTAFTRGGGVRNAYGLTVVEHSTITGNQAPAGEGSGVASRGYSTSRTDIRSTIIAGNTNSDVDFGTGSVNTFHSLGYNLIGTGNAAAAFAAAGDQMSVLDPLLSPLADNGGPTLPNGTKLLKHALLPGSPAVNAGDLNAKAGVADVPLYDERGEPFSRVFNGRIDIGAYEFQEPSDLNLLVDTLVDESDGNYARGDLSLREAIELANQWPSTDTIRFDPAATANGASTILLKLGDLKIADDLTINGPGSDLLTIDAGGNDLTPDIDDGKGSRIFNIDDNDIFHNKTVSLFGFMLTGGDVADGGGAVRTLENLTISQITISGNSSISGAIFSSNCSVRILRSAITRNHASASGGGIFGGIGQVDVSESDISDNSAGFAGGGIAMYYGHLVATETTITGNSDTVKGGGVSCRNATLELTDCTINRNSAREGGGVHTYGSTLILANSIISGNSASFGGGGGALSRYCQLTIIDSEFNDNSALYGGGLLFEDARLPTTAVTIAGTKFHNNSAKAGGGILVSSGTVAVSDSTISGNSATGYGGGGGAFLQSVTALIRNSTISSNSAIGGSGSGGGLYSGVSDTTLMNTTISGNSTDVNGGGIYSRYGHLRVLDSTISGNLARRDGGGIYASMEPYTSKGIYRSTITANTSRFGGGVFSVDGTLVLHQLILAENLATRGRDLTGLLGVTIDAHYSVIGSNADSGLIASPVGSQDANGNLIGGSDFATQIDPRLGALGYYGGPTMTHAILPGSPALNAGDPSAMAGVGNVPLYDQRGVPFERVFPGRIDIGAFESQPNPLVGDYNFNGVVDAVDYAVWRDTRNSTSDLRADGNGDGAVDDTDRIVWMANFGRTREARSGERGAGSATSVDISLRVDGLRPFLAMRSVQLDELGFAPETSRRRGRPSAADGASRIWHGSTNDTKRRDTALLAVASMGEYRDEELAASAPYKRQAADEIIDQNQQFRADLVDRVFEQL